jgi:hypothetical protein
MESLEVKSSRTSPEQQSSKWCPGLRHLTPFQGAQKLTFSKWHQDTPCPVQILSAGFDFTALTTHDRCFCCTLDSVCLKSGYRSVRRYRPSKPTSLRPAGNSVSVRGSCDQKGGERLPGDSEDISVKQSCVGPELQMMAKNCRGDNCLHLCTEPLKLCHQNVSINNNDSLTNIPRSF